MMRLLLLLLLLLLGCSSTQALAAAVTVEIPRLSLADFRSSYHSSDSKNNKWKETPVLIESALSLERCEAICAEIMSCNNGGSAGLCNSGIPVQLQRRRTDQATQVYPTMDLLKAADLMMQHSHHDDALWCFQEGLLADTSTTKDRRWLMISRELRNLRDSILGRIGKNGAEGAEDCWFNHFPEWAQPTDCVILTGEGATSTLHRDPFEWTGTSVCLEGSKIWRFIEPSFPNTVEAVDDLMQSYRLPSTAWGDNAGDNDDDSGMTVLSAGWQSDYSLYKTRKDGIPSARDWSDATGNDKHQHMLDIALSIDDLKPNLEIPFAVWTTVQKEGDFLVIPAHWWHQTYSLEPSLTVSSQRCSAQDARRVLNHMLQTTEVVGIDLDNICDLSRPQETVHRFFRLLEEKLKKLVL